METRASHIIVGGFVLTFLAGLVAFAIWIAKVDLDAEYLEYEVYFEGSVSGLYKRSIVFYSGIPVGDVRDISLAPNDPQKVRVIIRLEADVPVNEGAVARLEFQGLTGVAYIELQGGPPSAPAIVAEGAFSRPVIPAEDSAFQAIFQGAPDLINQAIVAVVQVQKLLSDKNIQSVSNTLNNADVLTANLARGTADLETVVAEARMVMTNVNTAITNISNLALTGDELLKEDARLMIAEATSALKNANTMLARIDNLVAANEESVTQFIGGSLPEVTRMIADLRQTAQSLSRLMNRIEQNPAGVIFAPEKAKYDLKTRKAEGGKK